MLILRFYIRIKKFVAIITSPFPSFFQLSSSSSFITIPSNTNPNPKMPSKKFYHLVGSNEKQFGFRNFSSNISCLVIITCSFLSLFVVCLYTSMLFPNDRNLTFNVVLNDHAIPPFNITVNPHIESSVKQPADNSVASNTESSGKHYSDKCSGKYIYVLDLPSQFNSDLLANCSTLNPWTDACKLLANSGLGPRLNFSDDSVFFGSNWFGTDQWSLEVIFYNRMKQYKCLTNDYYKSSAIYVPYFAGLDVGRYLWISNATIRDETSIKLAEYVREKPEWKRFGGRDHFLIAGRMTWDFSRGSDDMSANNGWGNRLLQLPEIKNMTSLLLESNHTSTSEIAIPYPTYFHPSSGNEVDNWQEEMRQKKRIYLFSFAGAPRPNDKESIRNILIEQCLAAKGENCKYVHTNADVKPETVMGLFQSSDFCLQPPGDSLTRKSIFDTILAGCIPVLFHPGSAYIQYVWHLPKDYSSYSVFIPMEELKQGNVSIEKRLLEIPKEKVLAMREEVIKLIPRIVYANPNSKVDNLEDALDVALKGVLSRVEKFKMEMDGGKNVIIRK